MKFSRALEEELPELSAYYTRSRYPNASLRRPSTEIGKPQAERSLNVARGVIKVVAKHILPAKFRSVIKKLAENLKDEKISLSFRQFG